MRRLSEHSTLFSQGYRQRIILSPWILQQRLAVSCCNDSSPEDAQMTTILISRSPCRLGCKRNFGRRVVPVRVVDRNPLLGFCAKEEIERG